MNAVAEVQARSVDLLDENGLIEAMEASVFPGAQSQSIKLVMLRCRAQGLDPFTKPFHIVPMRVKTAGTADEYRWRDVVMPGIGFYRTLAARSGHAGTDAGEFGPTIPFAYRVDAGERTIDVPEWCSVTVYRVVGGQRVAFSSGRVFWRETYATASARTTAPNAMWAKRPFGQLEKCAEALALRRAFPEVGAEPTADEMEGKVIEGEIAPPAPERQRPQPKTDAPAVTIDAETGEVVAQEPQAPAAKPDAPTATTESAKPADGARGAPAPAKIVDFLRRKLKSTGKTEAAAIAHVQAPSMDALTTDDVNRLLKWANEASDAA